MREKGRPVLVENWNGFAKGHVLYLPKQSTLTKEKLEEWKLTEHVSTRIMLIDENGDWLLVNVRRIFWLD